MANPVQVEKTVVLGIWPKFGPGARPEFENVEVHLRERVIDGQHFIELRDFFPDAMEYGRGFLLRHGGRRVGEKSHLREALVEILRILEESA